ncbi:sterile alpha motif domain-containing protein 9 isoform X1 [Epinephelus fuscoguttatus]|uniref:sterile alpha motif domain-containing protein 9 isoform X1 n=1 Tax=Epinephelus fuscoguttatus TaxID=293821 RepID=UPI0020D117A8|nr:sterile alpha motif domain-containing protein 9 isoform X1 [Epinephelus fuscoguttatus]
MEHNSAETVVPDSRDEIFVVGGEVFEAGNRHLDENVSQYVQQNKKSPNTQLFSFLALLNAYIPDAFLLMSECQKILGPPDPIHGGPPFEERMEPFTVLINTSSSSPERVRMIHPVLAEKAVELLADLGISRSATMKKFIFSFCESQLQPHILQFIKDLLTKRELEEKGKKKFSGLIEDIRFKENFHNAVSVLKMASRKLRQNPIFPQTISRLYYITESAIDYGKAEEWATKAIERAPNNSYVADTLGQVHKNRLMREARRWEDVINMAEKAFRAFEGVETKADEEEGPEMTDAAGVVSISDSYNNRGRFGFIQVAKITFEKSNNAGIYTTQAQRFIQSKRMEVEDKFDFFEWYLNYSKPDMTTLEPPYFWKDVVLCYELYTTKTASGSTSFPGLLDRLNRGLFTSKGRQAGFEEFKETVSDLEAVRDDLKTTYEANDVKAAERYILSNVILCNKMHNSTQLTPVDELKAVIHRFLDTEVGRRSPEFYLLALLLFWPEREPQVGQEDDDDDEEEEQQATEDDGSEDKTWEDEDSNEEQETKEEPEQLPLDLMFDPDLQQYVTFMEKAFERAEYAKYLRGRYLLPLFFLGKGSGLSKWIHKSRLDEIVEAQVDVELADDQDQRTAKKWARINEMWIEGDVWRVPEIRDMLLPVQVEQCNPQGYEAKEVFVYAGGKKIVAKVEPNALVLSPVLFYLGFTIQGPVVFKVGYPHVSGQ